MMTRAAGRCALYLVAHARHGDAFQRRRHDHGQLRHLARTTARRTGTSRTGSWRAISTTCRSCGSSPNAFLRLGRGGLADWRRSRRSESGSPLNVTIQGDRANTGTGGQRAGSGRPGSGDATASRTPTGLGLIELLRSRCVCGAGDFHVRQRAAQSAERPELDRHRPVVDEELPARRRLRDSSSASSCSTPSTP